MHNNRMQKIYLRAVRALSNTVRSIYPSRPWAILDLTIVTTKNEYIQKEAQILKYNV